mgnify:CR=1 FL=1
MDTQQIDVMVADASHEVYVDTILETMLPYEEPESQSAHTNT